MPGEVSDPFPQDIEISTGTEHALRNCLQKGGNALGCIRTECVPDRGSIKRQPLGPNRWPGRPGLSPVPQSGHQGHHHRKNAGLLRRRRAEARPEPLARFSDFQTACSNCILVRPTGRLESAPLSKMRPIASKRFESRCVDFSMITRQSLMPLSMIWLREFDTSRLLSHIVGVLPVVRWMKFAARSDPIVPSDPHLSPRWCSILRYQRY